MPRKGSTMREAHEFDSSELEGALEEAMRHFSVEDRNDVMQHPEEHLGDTPGIARARAIRRRMLEEQGFH